jgi:predicted CxxxxCH...CXXCH cytochrome family protein
MRPNRLLVTAAFASLIAFAACDKARPLPAPSGSSRSCTTCHGGQDNLTGAPPYSLPRNAAGDIVASGNRFDAAASTTRVEVGAHTAHLARGVACDACHVVPANLQSPNHNTGKQATVTFKEIAAANNVIPSTWTRTTPTCTNYCHGSAPTWTAGGSRHNPSWLVPAQGDCGTCHGQGAAGTNPLPPASSGHPQTDAAGAAITRQGCINCHRDTVNTDGTINLASGKHVNGVVDGGGHPAGWYDPANPPGTHGGGANGGLQNCTSCHGGDFAGGTSGVSCNACHASNGHPNWQTECTFCHGSTTRAADATFPNVGTGTVVRANLASPPVGSQGETNTVAYAVGAHEAHIAAGPFARASQCAECHGATLPSDLTHVGGTVLVGWGATASNGITPAPAGGNLVRWSDTTGVVPNCTNFCHGATLAGGTNATPKWNEGATGATCGSCHAIPLPYTAAGGWHVQRQDCATCHPGYTSSTVNVADHIFVGAGPQGLTCTSCHGSAANPAPPNDTAGATTGVKVGAHQKHLTGTTFTAAPLACAECHPTVSNPRHATGGVNLSWNLGATKWGSGAFPLVTPAAGGSLPAGWETTPTCANYCHGGFPNGNAATVNWTSTTAMTCNSCHGAGTGATATLPGGSHPQSNPDCSGCHTGYTTTSVVKATHLNGTLDVISMSCTACHGSTTRTSVAGADANQQAAPPIAASNNTAIGAHLAHVNMGAVVPALSGPFSCTNCHFGQVPLAAPHGDFSASPVKFGNIASAAAALPSYTLATQTCSSTYCHGQFTGGKTGTNITWNAAGKLTCTSCHGQGTTASQPTYPHPQNTTCASCHVGYTSTTVGAITHVDGMVSKVTDGCTACHGERTDIAVTPTVNLVKAAPGATGTLATSADTTGASATSAAGVGAHQAHLVGVGGTPRWRTAALACTECHAVPAINNTSHATGVGTGGAKAILTWGTLANGGATTVPTYATLTCNSVYCHNPKSTDTAATAKAPTWTGVTGLAACGSCHGLPPITAQHPTGATNCSSCHDGYANAPTIGSTGTAVSMANHINGVINVSSMSCTSCHGTAGRVSVTGADTLQEVAPPVAASNTLAVGAHMAHVNQQAAAPALSAPFACVNCHTGLIPTTAPHTPYPANPVAFGNIATVGATPLAYVTATQTCSNTYCHGQFTGGKNGTVITWNAAGKLTCTACHGQGTTASQPTYPHPQNTTCASCHTGYTSTAVAAATHVDGVVSKVTAGCTACHGERTDIAVTPTLNLVKAAPGATGTVTTSADTVGATATTAAGVGAHKAHLVGTAGTPRWRTAALACTECHAVPAINNTAHATGVGTGGAKALLTWGTLATGGATVVPAYTSPTCSSTYCHAPHADTAAGLTLAPSWVGVATAAACGSCHGLPPITAQHPTGATACGSCHDGYANAPTTASTSTAVSMANHINGVINVSNMNCTSCHGTAGRAPLAAGTDALLEVAPPVASSNALAVGAHLAHVNAGAVAPALSAPFACVNCHTGLIYTSAPHTVPANPVVFGNLATTGPVTPVAYATATQTCSNTYCHGQFPGGKNGNSITWNAAGKLTCNGCHGQTTPVATPQPTYPHAQNPNCVNCHGTGYSSTTVVAATHVNGSVTRLTAGCTSCHGELKAPGVTLTTNLVKAAPGASGTNSFDSVGGNTGNTVGAHRAHLVGAGAGTTPRWRSAAFTCTECHTLPPSNTDTSHATGVGNGGSRATLTFGALANDTAFETKTASYLTPTCTSVYCHNPKGTDTAAGNKLPAWNGATTTVVCGSCHGLPPVTAAHPTGVTECASCHGAGYATTMPTSASTIAQVNALLHIDGKLDGGGDCVGCHNSAQGTRRAIVPEFAQAWSHKRSAAGAVTKWDCVVCHMEGDAATGNPSGVHQNGVIDLRDPDTGATIKGVTFAQASATDPGAYTSTATDMTFAKFSRNLASTALEPAVQAIMINQCLKCHDADGALSSLARVPTPVMPNASAAKPFGTTISGAAYTGTGITAGGTLGGVVNVAASFAPTNSSYHPVMGKQNNSYVGNARLYAPWNTLAPGKTGGIINTAAAWGFLISCWDCHAPLGTASTATLTATVTAHGGATTLRQAYRVVNATNLCTVCHNVTVGANNHGAGSAWASGGHSSPGGIAKTSCYRCHSSNDTTTPPARPIPAQDVHGFNSFAPAMGTDQLWPVGATETYRPYGFMRSVGATGTWKTSSHKPLSGPGVPTGAATCGGSASVGTSGCGTENHATYTPGGAY